MKILALDFETSWAEPVNPQVMRITEIGAVLMDWGTKTPLELLSVMINDHEIPPSPKELVELTGITDEMRLIYGEKKPLALLKLHELMGKADFILAHNGNAFDKPILQAEFERVVYTMPDKVWIDSKTDIPYPKSIKTTKLSYLAAEHGFANPFQHRAIFDVLTMIKIVSHYDINEIIELAKQETVQVVASVSFQEKHLASGRGYYWNRDEKLWCKDLKVSKAELERTEAPFPTQIRRLHGNR